MHTGIAIFINVMPTLSAAPRIASVGPPESTATALRHPPSWTCPHAHRLQGLPKTCAVVAGSLSLHTAMGHSGTSGYKSAPRDRLPVCFLQ
jgi:hypothetical protein